MPKEVTMFFGSTEGNVTLEDFDEACWESARSSWIYMDMDPKQETCWFEKGFNVTPDEFETRRLNVTLCSDVISEGVEAGSLDTSGGCDGDMSLEFVEGYTLAHPEEDRDGEADYEDIDGDQEPCYESCDIQVSNDNFILKKVDRDILFRPRKEFSGREKSSTTRRSISLDSYPFPKNPVHLLKMSETFHYPAHINKQRALPPVPSEHSNSSTLAWPQTAQLSPVSLISMPGHLELDADKDSVLSLSTMATVSTATSWGSLYRIPAKVRKLSTSAKSTWSALTSKSVIKTVDPAIQDSSRVSPQVYTSSLPKFLREVFSYLWCDNPDRDPFNTFSVSETELTSAIAHLEQQLSTRVSNPEQKSRASLFSALLPQSSSAPSSPKHVAPDFRANDCENKPTPLDQLPFRVHFIMESYCSIYMTRKQDLRELKLLQKQENKQITDLAYKNKLALEAKERKFETDNATAKKTFDQELDMLTKQQKQQIEKAEQLQQNDMKNASKKIKAEQEKELKMFREKQKQEMKLLKQELEMLPRDSKKETAQKIRESKQIEMEEKERLFMENQAERLEKAMRQLADQHRQKIALLESQCLQQKQQLYRAREATVWEMEKSQLHERHQLMKTQLKDMFFVKRHQMLTRHQKEMENLKRYNQTKEDEMMNRHALEKRRLPKILKSEAKTRAQMFKQSLRLSVVGTPEDDKTKIKQFEESEKKRMKSEQQRQEEKHKRQLKALQDKNEAAVKELEQLQAEKRKMLMEQETQKIKELDDQFSSDMAQWKALLIPRKQALEEQFQKETEEQQSFYADVVEGNIPALPSIRSSTSTVRSKGKDGSNFSRHSTVI
nr:STE20-like serine/threonine-protein kinase [Biomphalaria glabrata]